MFLLWLWHISIFEYVKSMIDYLKLRELYTLFLNFEILRISKYCMFVSKQLAFEFRNPHIEISP